ncbi:MAG TPA: sigma-70 family RNA polymerase sigma factor [Gemmatimonadales bacterium]|nr:sigma-70 family RNA polymerase sigma factor [Gemmatimonadales bacterium]
MHTTVGLEAYRTGLMGHCYRMLGSVVEAEDAVQETMLRAWKAIDGFREDAALGTWLHRIATNVCLDALASADRRRVRPMDLSGTPAVVRDDMPLRQRSREHWVEPVPDALVLPADERDPEQALLLRESIRLAFVAALQYLPPRQRAVLLLTQVLHWSAAEAAEGLGMSVPAVNSALQRARATLAARNPAAMPRELTAGQQALLNRYVTAFERYDVAALTALLHEEVTMSMPPYELWLQGQASVAAWLRNQGSGCVGSRLVPLPSCAGMPAFAQYRQGGAQPWGLLLLELSGDRIASLNYFLDVETLFPRFGLPLRLADR